MVEHPTDLFPTQFCSFCCHNMSRYHLRQYEKEHMKMAMLKQEQTFKQQVRTKQLAWTSEIKQEPHIHATAS